MTSADCLIPARPPRSRRAAYRFPAVGLTLCLLLPLATGCQGWNPRAAIARWMADTPQIDEAAENKKLDAQLVEQRASPNPRLRAAAMRGLAERRHPRAVDWLSSAATGDMDLQVRLAAIAGLGVIATPEAQAALEKLSHTSGEGLRAAAIEALGQCGPVPRVFEAANDRSRRVRLAVAGVLARYPSPEAAAAAEHLLTDRSVEIQCRVVDALAKWPIEMAGPLLLRAMEKSAYGTRKAAGAQLAARWAPAAEYQVDDPPQRQAEVLERLRPQFHQEYPPPRQVSLPVNAPYTLPPEALAQAEAAIARLSAAQVEAGPRQEALAALHTLNADLVPALTALVLQKRVSLPDLVYTEVLARRDPVFAQIELLKQAAVNDRRRAAESLVQALAGRPAGLLVQERLVSIVIHESDPLVLELTLTALSQEPGAPAMRLAATCLAHRSPEVRRRACLNLAAHPRAEDERLLLRALTDPSVPVAIAAAQGLGALGHLDDPQPLRQAAQTGPDSLRAEAIIALARMDDPAGYEGLLRLSGSGDPTLRRRAAVTMGELGDLRYATILAGLLLDRPAVRRAALDSLQQLAGRDVAADGSPPADSSEVARRWKQWADARSVH